MIMKSNEIGLNFIYDSEGRILSINYFGNKDNRREFEYDRDGRLIRDINGKYETSFEYDELNRISRLITVYRVPNKDQKLVLNNLILDEEYKYDDNDNVIAKHMIDDSHFEFWYRYDQLGREIYRKTIDDDGDVSEASYEYDEVNRIIYNDARTDNERRESWFEYDDTGKARLIKETKYYE